MKGRTLDRILGKIQDLDATNLTVLVQRLARERSLLETVFNTIREGILVIDQLGVIHYSNATADEMIGIREEDVGIKVLWKLVPELAADLNRDHEGKLYHTGILSREIDISYPQKRYVRLYMLPLDSLADANQKRFTVILSDITEEKIMTEEMLANERISSIFILAAGVAHELGNPLNSINIHLQLIERMLKKLDEDRETQKIGEAVLVCRQEVERLNHVILHFLEGIKPKVLQLDIVDLMERLEHVLIIQKKELSDLKIEVLVDIQEKLPQIRGDSNQVEQVFFNIIKNAMEAMGPHGILKITTRIDQEYIYLYFADRGEGIDEEDLSNIFQPYFSTKKKGHGLGMMIVQRIMRDHGGKIGIDSKKGIGTIITLQFPLQSKRFKMLESVSL